MILVDSSVWIDYFNGNDTPQTLTLDNLLGVELLGIGDLILTEVLQGFRTDADYHTAKRLLTSLTAFNMLGCEMAIKSADNFRALRKQGITIRKTIDVIIATFCIENGHSLLFCDKDFIPFVDYLGLSAVAIDQ
jgi:predicted nucleic acid-binding protein